MSNKVTINTGFAKWINIGPIPLKAALNIYFTASGNWLGTFKFKIFNSEVKNTEFHSKDLLVDEFLLTLQIDLTETTIKYGYYYYEITHEESKRVLFYGKINLTN